MKRVSNLIPKIACIDNLMLAHYKAKKGKETKSPVRAFSENLQQNLKQLQAQILSGRVRVGNYHYFTVFDPKKRLICAAAYSERVLHHAIMTVCHPVFEQFQISDSYATRPQKGTFKAIARAGIFQKNYPFYWRFDIRKYFDTIDHCILLNMLHHRFKDPVLLTIFERTIYMHFKPYRFSKPIRFAIRFASYSLRVVFLYCQPNKNKLNLIFAQNIP